MHMFFFLTVFVFRFNTFFTFKKYSFGGYPFLKILENYSFLFYSFFPNFGIFFKKYSFMDSSFVANFRKIIRFGSFLPFFPATFLVCSKYFIFSFLVYLSSFSH